MRAFRPSLPAALASVPLMLFASMPLILFASVPLGATSLAIHIHSEKAMFQVLISPGTVGSDDFVLQLMSGEGALLAVKDAALVLSLPGGGVAPIERKASLGADGYWHAENVQIPAAGRWHLRIDATTPFKRITLEDDFDVPAQ
jgi:copper transport protein